MTSWMVPDNTVLHVDDESDLLDVTKAFLGREGLSVETAENASEGLARLEEGGIDCIVSDYDMSGMDGLEFLTAVRDRGLEVPFILFTGRGDEEVASEAISAGVSDYLQKEAGTEQYQVLANRVRNYAAQYRTEREIERVRERYELVARVGSDVIYEWEDEDDRVTFLSGFAEHFGVEPPERPDTEWWFEQVHPDDREGVRARLTEAIEAEVEELHLEYRVSHDDGGYRHVSEDRCNRYDDGRLVRIVGAVRDVTDRRRREQRLDALHEASRELMTATTVAEVVATLSRAAEEILNISLHAVYRLEGDLLVPETATDRVEEVFGGVPTIERGDGLMWEAVDTDRTRTYDDLTDNEEVYNDDTPVRSEFHVPIEGLGLFVAASTVPDDFAETDVRLVQVLVANGEAALARIDDELAGQ